MAKKSNTSPETTSSRAKLPIPISKKESAVPKHRRAQTNSPEAGAVESTSVAVAESSHHLEVSPEPEVSEFNITHEDIATLAFSYWERRGYVGGSPQEDWSRAESELQSLLGRVQVKAAGR